MDGLSGAASGIAVVSLAVQLGSSIKQLYEFWGSVKDAPDDIHAITTDLSLLSSVLAEMAFEEQHFGPDHTLTTALEACSDRVNKLAHITCDLEPGFASTRLRIRKWTAFKAVLKGEKLQRFQKVLEGLKTTLMLAQQSHYGRLDRMRYQDQRRDLTTISKHLSSLKLEMSATITTVSNSSSIVNEHTEALHREASRICGTVQNPVQRMGFQLGSDVAVQDIASNFPKDQNTTSGPLVDQGIAGYAPLCLDKTSHQPRRRKSTKNTLTIRDSLKQTVFGTITTTTETRFRRQNSDGNEALDGEEDQYEYESSFRIQPAQWLLKLGFNYAYHFSMLQSSTQGWKFGVKPINLVPDDASIFAFCEQGNVEKVRDLISRNLASVRDVDSEGQTALHFAVRSHSPALCNFLLEAGADQNARAIHSRFRGSPLKEISRHPITMDGLSDAIDICRIFESSFDFWANDGEGWDILALIADCNRDWSTAEVEATRMFLLWLIQSSSSDIKARHAADSRIDHLSILSRAHTGLTDAVELLMRLGAPRVVNNPQPTSSINLKGEPILHSLIIFQRWDQVTMLLALGANPHHVCHIDVPVLHPETPLSLAMYSSWAYCAFRNALFGINQDVEDIARKELRLGCPLLDGGWQMETLTTLLKLDLEHEIEPPRICGEKSFCNICGSSTSYNIQVQPYWQDKLESIKNKDYPQRVCANTQDEHSSRSRSDLTPPTEYSPTNSTDESLIVHGTASLEDQAVHLNEQLFDNGFESLRGIGSKKVWCIRCWDHFKRTGQRPSPAISETQPSEDDDFSPFLINT